MRISEARSNADRNTELRSKMSYKYIEPFNQNPNAYISMIDVQKIGINPSTGHDSTPAAIYAYPISEPTVWNQFTTGRLPYVSYARNIAFLLAKQDLFILKDDSSDGELEPFRQKLNGYMIKIIDEETWNECCDKILDVSSVRTKDGGWLKSPASTFFELTRVAASVVSMKMAHNDNPDFFINEHDSDYFIALPKRIDDKNRPLFWNTLLRKIGFDAVLDMGTGFVFGTEPYQAAFLHTGCFERIEFFKNGRSSIYGHGQEILSVSHFIGLINRKRINNKDALDMLDAMVDRCDPPASDSNNYASYKRDIRLSRNDIISVIRTVKANSGEPEIKRLLTKKDWKGDYAIGSMLSDAIEEVLLYDRI